MLAVVLGFTNPTASRPSSHAGDLVIVTGFVRERSSSTGRSGPPGWPLWPLSSSAADELLARVHVHGAARRVRSETRTF